MKSFYVAHGNPSTATQPCTLTKSRPARPVCRAAEIKTPTTHNPHAQQTRTLKSTKTPKTITGRKKKHTSIAKPPQVNQVQLRPSVSPVRALYTLPVYTLLTPFCSGLAAAPSPPSPPPLFPSCPPLSSTSSFSFFSTGELFSAEFPAEFSPELAFEKGLRELEGLGGGEGTSTMEGMASLSIRLASCLEEMPGSRRSSE